MEMFTLSATQAADLIRQRKISSAELVEALLHRISGLDPALRAWETVDRERALEQARRADREAPSGPLHGVPLGIKDIYYTAGLRTTSGSPIFRDFVPSHDSTAVARLRQAGAIILGKTVTVQFAHHDPPTTRNPWNHSRTPGGSSSGSAAAVAARMVPAAMGSQTGGSILRPASYCGVVGLKPTYGRVSRYGVTPASWSLDHMGPITRSVEDAALLLQVVAGPDPMDPASSHHPVGDYLGAARRKDRAPRLGLVPDFLEWAQPEVAAHMRDAAARLEAAGAEVREIRLPMAMPDILAVRSIIAEVEQASVHARLLKNNPQGYAPLVRGTVEVGQLIPATAYVQAQRLRRMLRPMMEEMLREVDCLVMPTVSNVAPPPDTTGDASFQAVWSLFGFPSITLPSGLTPGRLPFGTQLAALPFQEETLLSAAAWAEGVFSPMPSPV